ncbi:MAG TPA: NAD(P)/FAD-dependent oxidoreductase [Streptosporangiaceae bacterium]|nr:NAD(P)/FAD-dependent oxidoreductase [Streptosporangiaceae bacterium]
MAEREVLDAVIVGAGVAGLYQLYALRKLGLRVRVIEAADGVGGTWYWNRYPGARCDIHSMSYSYSFSAELEQDWEWTEKYPTQPELLRYLEHVADRFDLRPDITLRTTVTAARFDEPTSRWTLMTESGESVRAQFLILATGCLSASKLPEIPGLDRYRGRTHHTARWGKEEISFTGLRVGVIGTGSSGIQSIPVIAGQAAELTVFQRTPNFSFPAGNRPLEYSEVAELKASYREWREKQRTSGFGIPSEPATRSALEVSPAERDVAYQAGWDRADLTSLIGAFNDVLIDPAANESAAEFVRSKIRAVVTDPAVAERLSPRTFPIGTKRPCLDTGYFATFNQPHVRLVDLRATPLVEFTEAGLATTERAYELDAVVFATGFDAMTGAIAAIDVRGKGGIELASKWAAGPRNYLGLAVSGFPNLFTITGPLSPSVLSNMMVSIEQHVEWIADCIAALRASGWTAIEATAQAENAWVEHVAEVGSLTLFPTADSWYMGANVPGKPRVFMPYLGGVGTYRQRCDEVAERGYEGFTLTRAGHAAAA